jgi:hypothetical protein
VRAKLIEKAGAIAFIFNRRKGYQHTESSTDGELWKMAVKDSCGKIQISLIL